MMYLLRILIVAVAAMLPLGSALAQDNELVAVKAQGLVGERPDGFIGAVSPSATPQIRALVDRVNRQRVQIYTRAAQRANASVPDTQRIYGERLVRETPPGQYYMDAGGRWQRR